MWRAGFPVRLRGGLCGRVRGGGGAAGLPAAGGGGGGGGASDAEAEAGHAADGG